MLGVSELITRLKLGEMSQTKFATVDNSPLGEANKKIYLAAINKAITHLYSLFDLREGQFRLVPVIGQSEYTLDNAASITKYPDSGFVADSFVDTFTDHEVMNIQSCVLSDGTAVAINDPTDKYTVYLDKFNRIQIPNPVADVDYIFTYKAYHPKVTTIGGVVSTEDSMLDIPHYLEEALELLVGFYLMNTLATSNEFTNAADNIYARYVANIQATQDRMLLRTYSAVEPTVTDYRAKGWV